MAEIFEQRSFATCDVLVSQHFPDSSPGVLQVMVQERSQFCFPVLKLGTGFLQGNSLLDKTTGSLNPMACIHQTSHCPIWIWRTEQGLYRGTLEGFYRGNIRIMERNGSYTPGN